MSRTDTHLSSLSAANFSAIGTDVIFSPAAESVFPPCQPTDTRRLIGRTGIIGEARDAEFARRLNKRKKTTNGECLPG